MRWGWTGVGTACAVLAAVGIFGVLGWTAPPNVETSKTAETQLYIRTVPAGASVKVEGESRGISPLLVTVSPNVSRVVVEVELDGRSQKRVITLQGGRITRVEFPLQPPDAKGPIGKTAASPGLRLGPVQATLLPDPVKRSARLLDLDTGRWGDNDQFGEDDRKTHEWIRRQGVDVLGAVEVGAPGVLLFDAAVVEVPEEKWETLTPQEIIGDHRLNQQEPGKITALTPAQMVPKPEKRPTAIFQTREGRYGVVQVLEAVEQPKGVNIRYRLVVGEEKDARKRIEAQTVLKTLTRALEMYHLDVGRYPPSLDGLLKPPPQLDPSARWSGPYLRAEEMVLKDPWDRPYKYATPGKHQPKSFDLWSCGPDGVEGTADDLGNWPSALSAPTADEGSSKLEASKKPVPCR